MQGHTQNRTLTHEAWNDTMKNALPCFPVKIFGRFGHHGTKHGPGGDDRQWQNVSKGHEDFVLLDSDAFDLGRFSTIQSHESSQDEKHGKIPQDSYDIDNQSIIVKCVVEMTRGHLV
jgi:hypothetical protein